MFYEVHGLKRDVRLKSVESVNQTGFTRYYKMEIYSIYYGLTSQEYNKVMMTMDSILDVNVYVEPINCLLASVSYNVTEKISRL